MAAVLGRHEVVVDRHVVAVDAAVDDPDLVAFLRDDPLDERLVRVERVVEHHDVADLRLADAVGELVDDQAILIGERRRHALAFDAGDLEAERDDQRGVDRGRGQRLQPGDELLRRRGSTPSDVPSIASRRLRPDARTGAVTRPRRPSAAADRGSARPAIGCRRRRDVGARPASRAASASARRRRPARGTARRLGRRRRRRVRDRGGLAMSLIASDTRGAAWSAIGSPGSRCPSRPSSSGCSSG